MHKRTISQEEKNKKPSYHEYSKSCEFNINLTDEEQLVSSKLVLQMKNNTTEQVEDMIKKFTDLDLYHYTFFTNNIQNIDLEEDWKVKFMITEVISNTPTKFLRKFISPILQTSSHYEFGWFHTSVMIGPLYLEWTNRGLSFPKKIMSKSAIVAFDLGNVEPSEDMLRNISKVAFRWNTTKLYNNKENNCQHFVDDILKSINVDIDKFFSGALGKYMNLLRMGKTCAMEFPIPKPFQSDMKMSNITFTSHQMLDDFVRDIIQLDSKFEEKYPSDYQLLKAFDRAFWLRYYAMTSKESKEKEGMDVVRPCSKKGCVFEEPTKTHSFIKEEK